MWLRISSPLSQDNREIDWGWQITQPQQQFFFENRWLLQWTPLNVEIYVHTQPLYWFVETTLLFLYFLTKRLLTQVLQCKRIHSFGKCWVYSCPMVYWKVTLLMKLTTLPVHWWLEDRECGLIIVMLESFLEWITNICLIENNWR